MSFSYAAVAELLRINPPWIGFENCEFELRALPTAMALDQLLTCWGHNGAPAGSMGFDAHRAATNGPNDRVRRLADTFNLGVPVCGLAFSRNVLHRLGPSHYPQPGPELVVIDGNHRLAALAYRRATGQPNPSTVGMFVCE